MPRFALLTDAHIRQQLIDGLRRRGWDVERVIDVFPEGTDDEVLLEHASKTSRVFVTCDRRLQRVVANWLEQGRSLRLITWSQQHHRRMSEGGFIRAFEDLAREDDAFIYPVVHIKPSRD